MLPLDSVTSFKRTAGYDFHALRDNHIPAFTEIIKQNPLNNYKSLRACAPEPPTA